MFLKDNKESALPLYEVEELTMEEALLVLAADRELAQQPRAAHSRKSEIKSWNSASSKALPQRRILSH